MRLRWIGIGAAAASALLLFGGKRARATSPTGLTRAYDGAYRRHCPGVPVEYLRALAKRESNENPQNTEGAAWGLLQVIEAVRVSYNERFGTSISRHGLLNADTNVKIACELIVRVARLYGSRHPRAFPGGVNWADRRQAELMTFAWNAGWSDSRGVGAVVGALERDGFAAADITLDRVLAKADQMPEVSDFVRRRDKARWCKSVVDLYMRELRGAGT